MRFTEYKDFELTEQNNMTFVFKNCSINNVTGSAQIGFSGSYYDSVYNVDVPSSFSFKFLRGKIYDFEDRYISSYAAGQTLNLSGTFSGSFYDYSINGQKTCNVGSRIDFGVTHLWGDASDCSLDVEAEIFSKGYGLSIDFPASAVRESLITGVISNTSTEAKLIINDVQMRSSTAKYYSLESFPSSIPAGSTDNIVMKVSAGYEENLPLSLDVKTNVGNIYHIGVIKATEKPKLHVSSYLFPLGVSPRDLRSSNSDSTTGEFYYTTSILSGTQHLSGKVNVSLEYQGGKIGSYYAVAGVNITDGGTGYPEETSVIFSDGEITASGEAVVYNGAISEVNITNSGAYFLSPPTVSFSSSPSASTNALGVCLTESWEKTFTGSWELETGNANGAYRDYGSNGLTGYMGEAFYPYMNSGPGIYQDVSGASLTNEYPLYIRIKNKRNQNSSSDLAKLKITNEFAETRDGKYTKEITITGGYN